MAYTEVENTSWFGRIKNAFAGVVIGLVLFVAAFVLLWWNEGNSLRTYKMLKEVRGNVVHVESKKVVPGNENRLIHTVGETRTDETPRDKDFGVAVDAIRLKRTAEIYHWKEREHKRTKKKTGGGSRTVRTYTYTKTWSESPIDSARFHDAEYKNKNTGKMPYRSRTIDAEKVEMGDFLLSEELVRSIGSFKPYVPEPGKLPAKLADRAKHDGDGYFFGNDPAAPQIGDVRVRFAAAFPGTISVIGVQKGNGFERFQSAAGKSFLMLRIGRHTAEEMIAEKKRANRMLTWGLRVGGFVLMFIGLNLIFRPISVVGDVIPFLGSLIGMGIGLVAGVVSFGLSVLTIGIAWTACRPLVGIPLVVAAVASTVWLLSRRKAKKARAD